MNTFKTGHVAKLLDIDPKTVTNWADNPLFTEYLEPAARANSGRTQREFTDKDLMVLNTIRQFHAIEGQTFEETAKLISQGVRHTTLPPEGMTMDAGLTTLAQVEKGMVLVVERDNALARAQQLERAISTLERKLADKDLEVKGITNELIDLKREYAVAIAIATEQTKNALLNQELEFRRKGMLIDQPPKSTE